jgi:hypothetical protein
MEVYNVPAKLNLSSGSVAENWKKFKQQLDIYFKATEKDKKSHAVKIAILLNFIGEEGFEVYNTFTIPQDAAQKCVLFESVMHAFDEYCDPKKNELL